MFSMSCSICFFQTNWSDFNKETNLRKQITFNLSGLSTIELACLCTFELGYTFKGRMPMGREEKETFSQRMNYFIEVRYLEQTK